MAAVVSVAPNCLLLDTDTKLTKALLDACANATLVWQAGGEAEPVRGFARYLTLHSPESLRDLTADELALILGHDGYQGGGFGFFPVQHVLEPGWFASAQRGADLGGAAAENAQKIGILSSCSVAFDAEGVGNPGPQMVACLQAWAAEIAKVWSPVEYVGFDNGETPDQHYYSQPDVHLYWKAPGPWAVSKRSFAIYQGGQVVIGGAAFDKDKVGADNLGGRLRWMIDDRFIATAPTDPPPPAAQ